MPPQNNATLSAADRLAAAEAEIQQGQADDAAAQAELQKGKDDEAAAQAEITQGQTDETAAESDTPATPDDPAPDPPIDPPVDAPAAPDVPAGLPLSENPPAVVDQPQDTSALEPAPVAVVVPEAAPPDVPDDPAPDAPVDPAAIIPPPPPDTHAPIEDGLPDRGEMIEYAPADVADGTTYLALVTSVDTDAKTASLAVFYPDRIAFLRDVSGAFPKADPDDK